MKVCNICSASNPDDNIFCENCGSPLIDNSVKPADNNKNKLIIAVAVAVVVIVLAIGAIVLFASHNKKAGNKAEVTSEQSLADSVDEQASSKNVNMVFTAETTVPETTTKKTSSQSNQSSQGGTQMPSGSIQSRPQTPISGNAGFQGGSTNSSEIKQINPPPIQTYPSDSNEVLEVDYDQEDMNIFFSCFSEIDVDSFYGTPDSETIMHMAFVNALFYSYPDASDFTLNDYVIDGKEYIGRVSISYVKDFSETILGVTLSSDYIYSDNVYDGYYYDDLEDFYNAYSIITDIEFNTQTNEYFVEFDVYQRYDCDYMEKYYSYDEYDAYYDDDLIYVYSGSATLKECVINGETTLKITSYNVG